MGLERAATSTAAKASAGRIAAHAGEGEHVDIGSAGAQEASRCRLDGRTRGHDIVDEDDAAAPLARRAPARNGTRSLNVLGALLPRKADLLGCPALPDEEKRIVADAAFAGDCPGEEGGLVEPTPPKAQAVKRDGDDEV